MQNPFGSLFPSSSPSNNNTNQDEFQNEQKEEFKYMPFTFGRSTPDQLAAAAFMESCAAKTVLSGGAGRYLSR